MQPSIWRLGHVDELLARPAAPPSRRRSASPARAASPRSPASMRALGRGEVERRRRGGGDGDRQRRRLRCGVARSRRSWRATRRRSVGRQAAAPAWSCRTFPRRSARRASARPRPRGIPAPPARGRSAPCRAARRSRSRSRGWSASAAPRPPATRRAADGARRSRAPSPGSTPPQKLRPSLGRQHRAFGDAGQDKARACFRCPGPPVEATLALERASSPVLGR